MILTCNMSLIYQCLMLKLNGLSFSLGLINLLIQMGFQLSSIRSFGRIVRQDVLNYVHALFCSGSILKSLNQTFITLVPKVSFLEEVSCFRLISLCNVIYKTISKIPVSRLKPFMNMLITPF